MPGSQTAPRRQALAITRLSMLPSGKSRPSALGVNAFAAQWLAYMLPCRRFTATLAGSGARLGADVTRCVFIAVDFHHLLLAGLPAHALRSPPFQPALGTSS